MKLRCRVTRAWQRLTSRTAATCSLLVVSERYSRQPASPRFSCRGSGGHPCSPVKSHWSQSLRGHWAKPTTSCLYTVRLFNTDVFGTGQCCMLSVFACAWHISVHPVLRTPSHIATNYFSACPVKFIVPCLLHPQWFVVVERWTNDPCFVNLRPIPKILYHFCIRYLSRF